MIYYYQHYITINKILLSMIYYYQHYITINKILLSMIYYYQHYIIITIYIIKGVMSVYLFVYLLPMVGRTAGPIKTKLDMGTHVDPGSVLVKVKVIYVRVWYKQFMPATPSE